MILPGISGSFILVIFGKYDYIMSAVSELNIPVLVVFALGCCVGILAFAKFLGWLLSKYERQTMLVIVLRATSTAFSYMLFMFISSD